MAKIKQSTSNYVWSLLCAWLLGALVVGFIDKNRAQTEQGPSCLVHIVHKGEKLQPVVGDLEGIGGEDHL